MSAHRAVLWDMDGTLIDSAELHWVSWRETLANEGVTITREQFLATFGQRNDSTIPLLLGRAATSEYVAEISNTKEELYRHLIHRDVPADIVVHSLELLDPNAFETLLDGRPAR